MKRAKGHLSGAYLGLRGFHRGFCWCSYGLGFRQHPSDPFYWLRAYGVSQASGNGLRAGA